MTNEKLKSLFQFYYDHLIRTHAGVRAETLSDSDTLERVFRFTTEKRVSHLLHMCRMAETFVDTGRIPKAMRWLGFLQGALWSHGYFALDDLKHHSMPDNQKAVP
jgi:methionine salvage enolase-phosphatase E1